ncbi:MAG: CapA family protein [Defluviitaleaceae bacterium]|nr:CapA family protein [Defluviitaleaceae bacterium]
MKTTFITALIVVLILGAVGTIAAAVIIFLNGRENTGGDTGEAYALAVFAPEDPLPAEPEHASAPGPTPTPTPTPEPEPEAEEYIEWVCPNTVTILVSAAGDTTLGGDRRWAGYHAFMREFDESGGDHSIFLANVAHIFYESDISILNLEGVLTDILYPHMDKEFVFRGPKHFAQILSSSHIDVVSIANNHTIDFFERGMRDTRAALTYEGILYFGNEFNLITEVNGIKVGLFGFRIWWDGADNRNRITAAIEDLRSRGAQLIIAYHHWGVERENFPQPYQIAIGRHTIRAGADLVLGAHPHVLQGIEEYQGRFIVYSLADFSFGGNAFPHDHDTMIFQQTFTFYNGVLLPDNDINIIPAFMSSVRYRNDFRPTVAEGEQAQRIMARIERYSEVLR